MYLRRKCYSSLYDDLYNDYLYDKYFSENDDYDYYDQREFAMSPAEMAKLLYRETKCGLGKKGAYADKLAQKQIAKLEGLSNGVVYNNPRQLSKIADMQIESSKGASMNSRRMRTINKNLRNKEDYLRNYTKDFMN